MYENVFHNHSFKILNEICYHILRKYTVIKYIETLQIFLGSKFTLTIPTEFFIHRNPQVSLYRAALYPIITQPILVFEIALTQVQDLALVFVEPYVVYMGLSLESVKVIHLGLRLVTGVGHSKGVVSS